MKVQKITQGWWVKFCKRWSEIRLHKDDSFPLVPDKMASHSVFMSYFDLPDETLCKHGFKDKPIVMSQGYLLNTIYSKLLPLGE